MKLAVSAVMVLAPISVFSFAQAPPNEPTKQEIAEAYRSISGGVWETWRIKEIRGWKLHFKRGKQNHSVGVITVKYEAVAKKNGLCAEYQITHTTPVPSVNPHMKPMLVVEPSGVRACR